MVVVGKHGLSAFPGTNLMEELKAHGIETIALAGFMANCCVESTMRDAFDAGFNVVTLTDCVATTSKEGYKAAVEITYPFFSTPMNAASFAASILEQTKVVVHPCTFPKKNKEFDCPLPWKFRNLVGEDVYQVGPWFVDVRQSSVCENIILRSGKHELNRYLVFAQASGMHENLNDAIYTKKIPKEDEPSKPFGWLCHMTIIRLPSGGCLIYSPVLGQNNSIDPVVAGLTERQLLPVKVVIAPTPQHHLALHHYQQVFPDAFYICGKASGQMPPLTRYCIYGNKNFQENYDFIENMLNILYCYCYFEFLHSTTLIIL